MSDHRVVIIADHTHAGVTDQEPRRAVPRHPTNGTVRVVPAGGDRFAITIRDHELVADQPIGDGGEDTGPSPTELFVAGLAACVAHYARRYLARHGLAVDGLAVDTEFALGGRPARICDWTVRVTPPASLPADRYDAFHAVISHCTVHNTLHDPPQIAVELAPVPAGAGR
ncbi:MAG: OsmC family peroxiredoxin [Jatrophihabitans sp.]|nr:MAG: OsmC family peroxiredoxin [Jatrophihabitans sp.]